MPWPRPGFFGPAIREKLTRRDGGGCWLCTASVRLTIHHVVYRSQGGKDDLSNLVILCKACHRTRAHGPFAEQWQRVFRAYLAVRHVAEAYKDERVARRPPWSWWIQFTNFIKQKTRH